MSESTQLSRSRVAVLAISGVAAAYGLYTIYTTISERPAKSALHRSNAIRRHRPERQQPFRPTVYFKRPSDDAPLGTLVIRNSSGGEISANVTDVGIPSAAALELFETGLGADQVFVRDMHVNAVECILYAAATARSVGRYNALGDMGLRGLPGAIIGGDIGAVHRFAPDIQAVLSMNVTTEEILDGMKKFTDSEAFDSLSFHDSDSDENTFAETENADAVEGKPPEPSQGLKGLLYHIAEADAKRKAYEHRGIHCEECGEHPIRGLRYHCLNCPDFDLCSTCEANSEHQKTHVFAKIKIPLPVLSQPTKEIALWYPGDTRKLHAPLNAALKKRLGDEYGFEPEQMDANYDQFTCIANVPWPSDPNRILGAIDRRAFNKALTSERWPQRFRSNALYDRMFAFYDANSDGLIGFEEFISGLAYLRGPQRFTSLRRALEGFDIDGDGYVDRVDFLRLLRAKYEIQKLLISEVVEARENEQTQAAMETLRSSLPISSIFSAEEIPPGEERRPGAKVMDSVGDMQPQSGAPTIFDDNGTWSKQRDWRNGNEAVIQPHEQLQHQLSPFDDLVDDTTTNVYAISNGSGEVAQIPLEPYREIGIGSADTNGTLRNTTSEVNGDAETDEMLDQDVLWDIVEDGFHEMLDPLFRTKEVEDEELVATREERKRWRKEIERVVKEELKFREDLESASFVDPLMATANDSLSHMNGKHETDNHPSSPSTFKDNLVPTDAVSLERREAEIAQKPLEQLLKSTGYSVIEGGAESSQAALFEPGFVFEQTGADGAPEDNAVQDGFADFESEVRKSTNDDVWDPTMPQNRPNTVQPHSATSTPEIDDASVSRLQYRQSVQASETHLAEKHPSRTRLMELSGLFIPDRELQARGGPGRLSFDEVESIVKADQTDELRGLVKSWLEWASF